MTLSAAAIEARQAFQAAQGWEARSRLLLLWAERLPTVVQERDEDLVAGCESRVRLTHECREQRHFFRANSESRLLKGLLAVVLVRANGLDAMELAALDVHAWLTELGLERQLTQSRSNGLRAVLARMRELAG